MFLGKTNFTFALLDDLIRIGVSTVTSGFWKGLLFEFDLHKDFSAVFFFSFFWCFPVLIRFVLFWFWRSSLDVIQYDQSHKEIFWNLGLRFSRLDFPLAIALTTSPLTRIWKNDNHNCIRKRWKIVQVRAGHYSEVLVAYHLHGKNGNSGLKIKWLALFRLRRKYGTKIRKIWDVIWGDQSFNSFESFWLIWLFGYSVAGNSFTLSNFILSFMFMLDFHPGGLCKCKPPIVSRSHIFMDSNS